MKNIFAVILILSALSFTVSDALCAAKPARIVEENKTAAGIRIRILIPVYSDKEETAAQAAIEKAVEGVNAIARSKPSVGQAIDKIAAALKENGIKDAFINSDSEMYCLGVRGDGEMWKAWIPHPADKKKIFAVLRLKDKAVVTVSNNDMAASVVGDNVAYAEETARGLLAKGPAGMKAADESGIDAIVISRDGDKLVTELAGGFKEQYGKARKK
ncbi:MAG: FAD:protein FMN transferase [Candidatus Omnitrophica bacterium]|nr:FAD:protein FMN transferase [Candidatus Omnitrophota bacterium]